MTGALGAATPVARAAGNLAGEFGFSGFLEGDRPSRLPYRPPLDVGGLAPFGQGAGPTGAGTPVSPLVPPFPQLAQIADFERMVEKRPRRMPVEVHGIYLTGYTAGRNDTVDRLLQELGGTQFNAFVIDVKNDAGRVSYLPEVPLAKEIGAGTDWIGDPQALLTKLRSEGVYTIARIVVFKDPILARKHPELAVHDLSGEPWRDRTGASWLDPYNRGNWDYVVAVAQEAAAVGFDEIQFDYVRFPSDGQTSRITYGDAKGTKADTIAAFLTYAREKLKPYDVFLSADIFGLVGTATDDMGIGQQLEKILGTVDYISPMVYPSHYGARNYGLEDPEAAPYQTVLASLRDYQRRMTAVGSKTGLRPWLQDFSLRVHYGPGEVLDQIKAGRDLGVGGFILWNPANTYNISVFKEDWESTGQTP
ncbi:MAG: putative glycoside hydrolase [Bacillota bacterium]